MTNVSLYAVKYMPIHTENGKIHLSRHKISRSIWLLKPFIFSVAWNFVSLRPCDFKILNWFLSHSTLNLWMFEFESILEPTRVEFVSLCVYVLYFKCASALEYLKKYKVWEHFSTLQYMIRFCSKFPWKFCFLINFQAHLLSSRWIY